MATSTHSIDEHVKDFEAEAASVAEPLQSDLHSPEICVICLNRISEKAAVLPCNHDQFDFLCIGTWVQQRHVCPLCKSEVKAIKYNSEQKQGETSIFYLAETKTACEHDHVNRRRVPHTYRHRPYSGRNGVLESRHRPRSEVTIDAALDFRRQVYRDKMYSLRVGTNRISKYRNVTPSMFRSNPHLLSRAKMFVRRELSVFDFLNPSSESFGTPSRRASNAEFLLEYIMGILTSIDLRSSTGQAEELLRDFLGRDNARLFIHELEAWLRSPYEKLADWDRHVQYGQGVREWI